MRKALLLSFVLLPLLLLVAAGQGLSVKTIMHLHCSDIPDDDGQKSLFFLAHKAVSEGYGCVIITPHCDPADLAKGDLIKKLPDCPNLTIIVGREVNESGAHVLEFDDVRVWAHPWYPVEGALPRSFCQFYEVFNERVAKQAQMDLFLSPTNVTRLKSLVGEDWHGGDKPFRTAIIAEAENMSEAAIVAALKDGNYALSVDGVDVAGQVAMARELE